MTDVQAEGDATGVATLTKKDFTSGQEPRWCPGCGDYAILAAVQGFMPELGIEPQNTVFISGIGCSGRFTYYMDTYGFHGIHGRAPAIATGVATARPDLSVWVVTGDGDALSIGGNHLIHALRRNVNLKILMFNNQIYGLTKGQYSPTSEVGKVTKSTPFGSVDRPFNPVALALGAAATFVARTIDNDRQHLTETLRQAAAHPGAAFVEIYQNCNVFNDGAFDLLRDKPQGAHNQIRLVDGEPILFDDGQRCVRVGRTAGSWSPTSPTPILPRSSCTTCTGARPSRSRSPTCRAGRPSPPASASSARCRSRPTARRCTSSSRARRSGWEQATSRSCCTAATPGRSAEARRLRRPAR
jgi:2-oxoglutarate ferredoxin oxidoreductase subunit beta